MPGNQNSKDTLEFLGGLGTDDRGDKDVKYSNSAKALVELGNFLINQARKNLTSKGHVASGETSESMHIANIDVKTLRMSLDVLIKDTYKFLDQGVKGTVTGQGKYSFKNSHPSKKMAAAILMWARVRAMGGKVKYSAKGLQEAKNKAINKTVRSSDNLKSLAYAISTNIKKHGIPKTRFFENAIKDTKDLQKKKFAQAFKLDIIQQLS